MKFFIFRNNTLENIFGTDEVEYSGYEDISYIPQNTSLYLWMYQIPIRWNQKQLADEIDAYIRKMQLVFSQVPQGKEFVAFTLVDIFPTRFTDANFIVREAIVRYNTQLYNMAGTNVNFKVIDFSEFTSRYRSEELIGWKFYFISQMYISSKITSEFATWVDSKIQNIALKRKKCLILDLDNTLWGGVLGEEGINGIQIGGDYPGKAFLYFQEALSALSKEGIILSVCSKNNEEDVFDAWEQNPFMVLRKKDFVAIRINWNDKASNIVELSKELNIGLDSMVFIDDNPAERELVKQTLPMVAVPDFPKQAYMLPQFFMQLVREYFEVYEITGEDKKKTEQYKANAERTREQAKFLNFEDFLRSLEIKIELQKVDSFNISRIAQMTQKTNQFNLTTQRYSEADVRQLLDNQWKIYCIRVSDKFGDNGITGAVFITDNSIENILLSCRILGKGIETAFIKFVFKLLVEDGVSALEAKFIPALKNRQVADFYDRLGFSVMRVEEGVKYYMANIDKLDLSIPDYYSITVKQ